MIRQSLIPQIEFAVKMQIRDSTQPCRQALLRELLNSAPVVCRTGRASVFWDRCCRAAVAALPWDHFDGRLRASRRPPTVLDLLRR
jgi:hypothetical protein